jgi:hypothetical protein
VFADRTVPEVAKPLMEGLAKAARERGFICHLWRANHRYEGDLIHIDIRFTFCCPCGNNIAEGLNVIVTREFLDCVPDPVGFLIEKIRQV